MMRQSRGATEVPGVQPEPTPPQPEIEALLQEQRTFPPDPAFVATANATAEVYAEAERDPVAFWAAQARDRLSWTTPFETTLEWDPPFARWFVGGELNVAYNCVDRHVERGLGEKIAYHWIGEPGDTRTITYRDLQARVNRAANALRELGVENGDRVAIYMPMIPELPVAMLACARIGAPFTVVFGGFSAEALAGRINDAGAKVLVTADGGWRRGKASGLKHHADEAIASTPDDRGRPRRRPHRRRRHMVEGRDHWWHELVERQPAPAPPVPVDSEHMLYLLYTSGTTAKPKGIVHSTAGYLLGASFTHHASSTSSRTTCTGAPPTSAGSPATATSCSARSPTPPPGSSTRARPDTPAWDRWWQIVEDYRVTILYTAPTAIRAFMKQGEASRAGTTCRRCGSSALSASRSTPRPGSGTTPTSAAAGRRSSTRGGRPRPAAS